MKKNQLIKVNPKDYKLPKETAEQVTKGLEIPLKEREILEKEFKEISKLEISKENLSKFKELRLKIVKNRTQGIMQWHKNAKEFFLRGGQFVDAIKRLQVEINLQMEKKLKDAEEYYDRLERERIEKLQQERLAEIQRIDPEIERSDLGYMPENDYLIFKKGVEQIAKEKAEKLERERLEKEKLERFENLKIELRKYEFFMTPDDEIDINISDADFKKLIKKLEKRKISYEKEQEKIRKENERLKAEKERLEKERLEKERLERERLEKLEREKEKIRLEKERLEREKAEKERLEKERLERERLEKERQAEIEKAKSEIDKVNDLVLKISSIKQDVNDFKSKKYKNLILNVNILLQKTIDYIKSNK